MGTLFSLTNEFLDQMLLQSVLSQLIEPTNLVEYIQSLALLRPEEYIAPNQSRNDPAPGTQPLNCLLWWWLHKL